MKRLTVGILAHVDSGKTTLSEGILYAAGEISKLGRVDHKNAFLDTDEIEKDRGITIFSKQAQIHCNDCDISLLDTPGHVDFSPETERAMRVLDYAILVISASDGVQSHSETLWKLLCHYNIPTFVFINKTDLVDEEQKKNIMRELKEKFSSQCVDFSKKDYMFFEEAAMGDEVYIEEFLQSGELSDESLKNAIVSRKLFACFFGSALKNEGVKEFLDAFCFYVKEKIFYDEFAAKIFKIDEDDKGQKLAYMKITGGCLKVKSVIDLNGKSEKVNEIRIYSGAKYKSTDCVHAGNVCAVCGLASANAGDTLGKEPQSGCLVSEPVFTYSVKICDNTDIYTLLGVLKKIEAQETQLKVVYNETLKKIDVCVMGEIALEVLKRILFERYNIKADFERGSIIYKETIENEVEGVGHFEPLRHYSEVHLLMQPLKPSSGLVFETKCKEDVLGKNWQRLIMTHLQEKTHIGVLMGAPITDMKITLVSGKAHIKHTEGGDFRQATYRAVRQGLMQAKSVLLEPYYSFSLEVPTECVGRAMTDLKMRGAEFETPYTKDNNISCIKGSAPVRTIWDYHSEINAYTHGLGRFFMSFKGYEKCNDAQKIIKESGYLAESDTQNPTGSVFCSHGSAYTVRWDEVFEHMHIPLLNQDKNADTANNTVKEYTRAIASEAELLRIFEMTYGKVKRKQAAPLMKNSAQEKKYKSKPVEKKEEYLLIDGYNIIFAWDELKNAAADNLQAARELLINKIANYRAMKQSNVILVFDAYRVPGDKREIERIHGIDVVYTKEAETADSYIEKTTKKLCKNYKVRVATSDNLEQIIIFGHGAVRVSAKEFYEELVAEEIKMREFIENYN